MADFTVTGLDTVAKTLLDTEFGLVGTGADLVVNGADAITGSGSNRLIVYGTVTSTQSSYDFDGVDVDVFIGTLGAMVSANTHAIELDVEFRGEVTNNGSIMADDTGIVMRNTDPGFAANIINNGQISGAIGVNIDAGTGQVLIANTGVISTNVTSIQSLGSGKVELANSGTILSSGANAINFSTGSDIIINTGTIVGRVSTGTGDDLFDGREGIQASNSFVSMSGGNDTFLGGEGDERISGGADSDEMFASGGNDTIFGDRDSANDLYDGGDGVDLIDYRASTLPLKVDLGVGLATGDFIGVDQLVSIENVFTGSGDDVVIGNAENNVLRLGFGADRGFGLGGHDRMLGDSGNDTLIGGDGNDRLFGEDDDDRLFGENGNDVLNAGLGRDVMTGGAGSDHFVFTDIADSGAAAGTFDRIRDFEQGIDKFNVSGIDALPAGLEDNEFVFIGTTAFSGTSGELRFRQSATLTIVELDDDGDGVADMAVRLDGVINLTATDFVL